MPIPFGSGAVTVALVPMTLPRIVAVGMSVTVGTEDDALSLGVDLLVVVARDQVAVGGVGAADLVSDAAERVDAPDLTRDPDAARHRHPVRRRPDVVAEDLDAVARAIRRSRSP